MTLWWDTVKGIATTAPREHVALLRADMRYAIRNFRRNPGFTAVAAIVLAVGIGADAAVFTIVDGVLIAALPYKDPQQLVVMIEKVPYSGMAAFRNVEYELSGVASPERLDAVRVSPELFSVLGVSPMLGRALTADDDRANAKVVVLSHGLWTRALGREPSILGRAVILDRQPYAVVARLKPGVTIEEARGELASVARTIAERYPPAMQNMLSELSLPMEPRSPTRSSAAAAACSPF
jgi:hypothetical protein